jgi:manganese/zinc/iron transport system ATP- binding protein
VTRPALKSVAGVGHETDPLVPLDIRGMTVAYGRKPVVYDVDFAAPAGRMAAIIGPNGAGKSSLLKAALGIVPSISGRVTIFGMPLSEARQRVAYVPQRAGVDWDFPATVLDVVVMGLYRRIGLLRFAGRREKASALACLEQVGMAAFAGRQIGQLSGGQQQRVFLARALAQSADLLLLDEPFAGVDAATERAIVQVLRNLNAAGKTIVCVHHDLATVADYFDYVLLMNVRKVAEGAVAEAFTPETLQHTYGGRLTSAQVAEIARGRSEALDPTGGAG